MESFNTWEKKLPEEILKKYIESGYEINESHKELMRIYNGE